MINAASIADEVLSSWCSIGGAVELSLHRGTRQASLYRIFTFVALAFTGTFTLLSHTENTHRRT
jgi:hypothetical protein